MTFGPSLIDLMEIYPPEEMHKILLNIETVSLTRLLPSEMSSASPTTLCGYPDISEKCF